MEHQSKARGSSALIFLKGASAGLAKGLAGLSAAGADPLAALISLKQCSVSDVVLDAA